MSLLLKAKAAAEAKRYAEAEKLCREELEANPKSADAFAMLGTLYGLQDSHDEAIRYLEKACYLNPGVATWHAHRAALLRVNNQMERAVMAAEAAVKLEPNNVELLLNLALVYADDDKVERSNATLLRAIGLKQDHATAHLALAQNLLGAGDYASGWREYEWRNLMPELAVSLPPVTSAPWNGMMLPEARILVVADQGYGDSIQFARYLPWVAGCCREVVVGCSQELVPLFRSFPEVHSVHYRWDEIPAHAAHVRISSLGFIYGTKLHTVPYRQGYIIPDAGTVHERAVRFPGVNPLAMRIGLAWRGRGTHPNDKRRSIPLERLTPLAEKFPDVCWVSLQKPVEAADAEAMSKFKMLDFSEEMTDWGETAALLCNLDMLICVDTAVAHLAGAMSIPAWVMLPYSCDWRWPKGMGQESIWYDSVRLFRQPKPGDWDTVLDEIVMGLRKHAED